MHGIRVPLAPSFDTTGPMVRNVTDAAILLGAIAGTDPEDAATADADDNVPPDRDYTVFLNDQALQGVRLGSENPNSQGTALRNAITALEAQGAEIVDIDDFEDRKPVGLVEIAAIFGEFHAFMNSYLASEADPPTGVESLREIVIYNYNNSDRTPYGQNYVIASAATPGIEATTIPQSITTRLAAQAVIDDTLATYELDAIIDTGNGNANIGAAAGYPTVAVPATGNTDRPTSVSFLGPAWSDGELLGYAYDFEQATLARTPPTVVNPDELRTPACPGS